MKGSLPLPPTMINRRASETHIFLLPISLIVGQHLEALRVIIGRRSQQFSHSPTYSGINNWFYLLLRMVLEPSSAPSNEFHDGPKQATNGYRLIEVHRFY